VGGEWAEVKTVVIGEVDETVAEPGRLKEMFYFYWIRGQELHPAGFGGDPPARGG